MEIGERQRLQVLEQELEVWASKEEAARLRLFEAEEEIDVYLIMHDIDTSKSLRTQFVELKKIEDTHASEAVTEYKLSTQRIKIAERQSKKLETLINNFKFINRPIL